MNNEYKYNRGRKYVDTRRSEDGIDMGASKKTKKVIYNKKIKRNIYRRK